MYIHRLLEKKFKQLSKTYPVVALTGPRQSGKTTLVKKIFPDKKYLSLENLDTRAFAQKDPKGFLKTYNKGVIIDEAQNAPELFSYIQEIVDVNKKSGEFILTGSQNFLLMEKINQSLAGRVAIVTLLPMSADELSEKLKRANLNRLMLDGLYPVIYEKKIDAAEWYQNYIKTYIERDVRMMKNISDLNLFQKFIKLCAGRVGQILNLSSMANDCGVSHNTIKGWISIIEASYIIFLLYPYYENFSKRLIKMPKIYFYDTGLAASLLNINSEDQLDISPFKGGLFESFIISEIIKNEYNKGLSLNIYFWRDKSGHEIDCLYENKRKKYAIEIKSGKTINNDFFDSLNYLQKISKNIFTNLVLVYGGIEKQNRSNATVLGWNNFIAELNK
ncbi:ATP-binding protein [Patescibacteria group bacterium]|nr:ATP-binding protein [Patescibacteria group bacterium]